MITQHASVDTVERFLRAEGSQDERAGLIRHLLARCPECLQATGEVPEARTLGVHPGGPIPATSYDDVFARVESQVRKVAKSLTQERSDAARLAQGLRGISPEQQKIRVRNDRRFHTWGFAEHLIAEGRDVVRHDPARAVDTAELAVEVLHRLDAERYGVERLADLRALAWEAVGNARRWHSDFEGAADAFRCAREELGKGTGDNLTEAMVASSEAALAIEQGRFEGVDESLNRAIRVFRKVQDPYFEGRALLLKAVTVGPVDPDRGTDLLRRALERIEQGAPGRSARLVERLAPLIQPWEGHARLRSRA